MRSARGAECEELLAATAPGLEGFDILAEFMRIMGETPILPAQLRWQQRLLRCGEATVVRALARGAALLPLDDAPPAQAARRLAPI